MSVDFSTENFTIINYVPFTGGNFIANCLSLSKHTVPKSHIAAEYLIDNSDDYAYRFDFICRSLPPIKDMNKWVTDYEFKDVDFFGKQWRCNRPASNLHPIVKQVIDKNLDFFVVGHGGNVQQTLEFLKYWPNAKIINLINGEQFWKLAIKLKNPRPNVSIKTIAGDMCSESYNQLAGGNWPAWDAVQRCNCNVDLLKQQISLTVDIEQEIKQYYQWHLIKNPIYQFDIDSNIFDKNNFLNAMNVLYTQLGYTDFNPELVGKFWALYMSLHVDNVEVI